MAATIPLADAGVLAAPATSMKRFAVTAEPEVATCPGVSIVEWIAFDNRREMVDGDDGSRRRWNSRDVAAF